MFDDKTQKIVMVDRMLQGLLGATYTMLHPWKFAYQAGEEGMLVSNKSMDISIACSFITPDDIGNATFSIVTSDQRLIMCEGISSLREQIVYLCQQG